jgi:hypothetical protein
MRKILIGTDKPFENTEQFIDRTNHPTVNMYGATHLYQYKKIVEDEEAAQVVSAATEAMQRQGIRVTNVTYVSIPIYHNPLYKVIIKTDKSLEDTITSLYQVTSQPKEESAVDEYVHCVRTLHTWDNAKILMDEAIRQSKTQGIKIRKIEVTESLDPKNEVLP